MANWLGGLQGSLGGAGTGAAIGSIVPGIGTAIGAGLGGLVGGLGGLFGGGEKGGVKQAPNFNPQQQQILSMLLGQGQMNLQNPYAGFEDIANYAQNQFNQNIVPSLAERFTSLGNNALSSGAFATQVGQAGRGLGDTLGLLRSQYGQQNQQNALQQLALGLSPSFQNFYQQSQPGFGENLLSGAIQAAPSFYQSHMLNNALRNMQPR
jgi:hypothetical protein